jgi:putative redox protein
VAHVEIETIPGRAFGTNVSTYAHSLVADEPSPDGDDLGFSPYELLLASLGSCTAMTLEMYARRKQWPLEQVRISLEFSRTHVVDAGDSESPARRVETITREFELIGDLSEEQKQRLLEIAGRCPVHRTLTANPPTIVDRLASEVSAG